MLDVATIRAAADAPRFSTKCRYAAMSDADALIAPDGRYSMFQYGNAAVSPLRYTVAADVVGGWKYVAVLIPIGTKRFCVTNASNRWPVSFSTIYPATAG